MYKQNPQLLYLPQNIKGIIDWPHRLQFTDWLCVSGKHFGKISWFCVALIWIFSLTISVSDYIEYYYLAVHAGSVGKWRVLSYSLTPYKTKNLSITN